jgi:chorismate mutase
MTDLSSPIAPPQVTLASLRGELDRLDDQIHDLLMARARVVEQVGALGAKGPVALRPGREADIIRRLLARHAGALPRRVLPRLWRELFAATTAMQGPYVVAVCEVQPGAGFVAAAREHFGMLTPLRAHRSPAQALAEVSSGSATVAVLPMPAEDEPQSAAWWTALLQRDQPRIHVVARLPFWSPRPEGASTARALVVATVPPDASARDRSLIGLELPGEMSRARLTAALAEAGLSLGGSILRRDPHDPTALALLDVEGMVADDDPRLAQLSASRPPVVLGAYAVPVDGDTP